MQTKKDAIEQLKPFYGKTVSVGGGEFYIFRPKDMDSEGEFLEDVFENFEGSEDEDGEQIDFREYIIFACDDVELEDGELEFSQVSDFIALHRESGKVIHVSEGTFDSSYGSIEDFIAALE